MELALQIVSNEKTVRINTVQDWKDFNSQLSATQIEKGEHLVSMKGFDLIGDDIVELSTENEALKYEKGSYEKKWSEASKTKLLRQIDNEKKANFIMSRMEKQREKQ